MISPVSATSPAQPATSSPAANQKQSPTKPQTTSVTDTVQLSDTAQAALQEATESYAQTLKEAAGGDPQAQRLLAQEDAAAQKR